MIHPNTELRFINNQIGYGVFATKFIPKGTLTYVKDPLEITISPKAFGKLLQSIQASIDKYSYIDEKGDRIMSWDHGKYVNHCCNSNTISTGYGFEIAIHDIQEGEEITDEYGLFNIGKEMELFCSKPNCRTTIRPTDILDYANYWDEKVKKALLQFKKVEQPLASLLDGRTLDSIYSFLKDPNQYISVERLLNKEGHYIITNNQAYTRNKK